MCGIFSVLNNIYNVNLLKEKFNKGANRGPESSKIIVQEFYNYVIGFHRLAINGYKDLTSEQPIETSNYILICNGEIYNWKEMYKIIGEDNKKTGSDCEIIIHLYKKYGIKQTLQMLDGVFAFMLFDKLDDIVYIARDTYGIRPLFYCNNNGSHLFASEMKMLIGLNKNNPIQQFKPGTYSKFKYENKQYNNIFMNVHYSSPNSFINNDIDNEDKALMTIRTSLINAVRKRVDNTDREVACLLSGGLDSSLISAIVSKHLTKNKLNTWSIGLEGSEDIKYAQLVADHIGSNHHSIILSEDDFLNVISDVIYDIESYDTTTVRASVGNWLISKHIKDKSEAKVIFNGDGSDEVCGGYMYFHLAPDHISFDKECRKLLSDIHYFDVLRSDRSIASHGLEPRTPFLDRNFVQSYLSIPLKFRVHNQNNQCEKYLLRKAFDGLNILPNNVLWRTKEAFSDGVSKHTRSWYEIIQEHLKNNIFKINENDKTVDEIIEDYVNMYDLKYNKPKTLEQLYYRLVFEKHYKHQSKSIPYFWMPNFVNATDASARTLNIYKNKMNINND